MGRDAFTTTLVVLDGTVSGNLSLPWRVKFDFREIGKRQDSYAWRTRFCFLQGFLVTTKYWWTSLLEHSEFDSRIIAVR